MSKELIYLACPYSDPDPDVIRFRFESANLISAKLMAEGHLIFSPISHCHPIAMAGDLPKGWDFWERYDRTMLEACYKIIVLKLPGWTTSKGVTAELKIARELGLEIEYIDSSPLTNNQILKQDEQEPFVYTNAMAKLAFDNGVKAIHYPAPPYDMPMTGRALRFTSLHDLEDYITSLRPHL
jgi:hypothetical protein